MIAETNQGPVPPGALRLTERLEALWQRDQRPDIHAFLADAGSVAPVELATLLRIDQWQRWHGGERIGAEEYLKRYPILESDPELALKLVYGEFLVREALGEAPAAADYLQRFPRYAVRLQEQWQLHGALEGNTQQGDGSSVPGEEGTELQAPGHVHPPAPATTAPWPVLNGFQILQELGRGGMGVVYKARQLSLKRVVALKMILAGDYAGDSLRARFRSEAEAVARLQHPNIVQIYEIGEQQGRPYLALEFLEGGSLARRLDGVPWPAQAAAQLVETLARAAHVAHQRHIIHRDLKPGNVLLAADGTPKLADFGLAKLVDSDQGQTGSGAVLGTPSYMAPEQAEGHRHDVSPATDVYALGAILYVLLTGRPPFRAETAVDTVLQVIHEEPVAPARLNPKVPRDLQTICLKCLHKDPARRYTSAAALADDLGRFLAGRPVTARPVGKVERLARWVKRHPAPAALLALTLLVVALGFGSFLGYQQWQIEQAQQGARGAYLRQEVDAALHEADEVRQELHRTLGDSLRVHELLSDPAKWGGALQAVRAAWKRAEKLANAEPDLLDADQVARLQELKDQLAADEQDYQLAKALDDTRLQASALIEGKYNPWAAGPKYAVQLAGFGLDLEKGDLNQVVARIRRSPIRHALAATLDHWAIVNRQASLLPRLLEAARRGDPDPWRDQFRQLAAWTDQRKLEHLAQQVSGSLSGQSPQILLALAARLRATGGDARPLMKAALVRYPDDFWLNLEMGAAFPKLVDRANYYRAALALRPRSPLAHLNLGAAMQPRDLEGAIQHYLRALELDPNYGRAHHNLGWALYTRRDLDGAIRSYTRALEVDPNNFASHLNLGLALYARKHLDRAIQHYTRALELDPNSANAHNNLGLALYDKGDLNGAIQHYRRALELDPNYTYANVNLAVAMFKKKDTDGAIQNFARFFKLNPNLAEAEVKQGLALNAKNDQAGAIRHFRRALELDPNYSPAHFHLANALLAKQDKPGAIRHFTRNVQLNPKSAEAHWHMGYACYVNGDWQGSFQHHSQALRLNPNYSAAHNSMGVLLRDKRDWEGAIRHYTKAVELVPTFSMAHYNLGWVLNARKDLDGAIKCYRRALQIEPNFTWAHYQLGNALLERGQFAEALQELQLAKQPPAAPLVQRCQHLLQLDKQLTAILAGQAQPPGTAAGQLELAELCWQYKRFHAAAVRFYAGALAAAPPPVPETLLTHRSQAACSAVLAAAGQGLPSARPNAAEQARLRQQALAWLRADLDQVGSVLSFSPGKPKTGQGLKGLQAQATPSATTNPVVAVLRAQDQLARWQTDSNLAGVRVARNLAQLPPAERHAWQTFWADVGAHQKRAETLFITTKFSGTLTDAQRVQEHSVDWLAGKTYVVELRSQHFDAFLRLNDIAGTKMAEDDDSAGGHDARIVFTPQRAGNYRILATSFGRWGQGRYTLLIREFTGPGKGS